VVFRALEIGGRHVRAQFAAECAAMRNASLLHSAVTALRSAAAADAPEQAFRGLHHAQAALLALKKGGRGLGVG